MRMAAHLERTGKGFALVSNIDFLVAPLGEIRWTRENAPHFVELLNDFYNVSGFAAFFERHIAYFEEHTARFIAEVYGDVNHEWFRQHGLNPNNMRVIISPGCSFRGYAAWIFGDTPEDTIVYAAIPGTENYSRLFTLVIHEYVHAFADPIAEIWYAENETFRAWSNASVDLARMPFYPTGQIMANEYVTRAFTVLYMAENTRANPVLLLLNEKSNGFPYIFEVYAMVTGDTPIDLSGDVISLIFADADFLIDETEHSISLGEQVVTWRFLRLQEYVLDINALSFSEVGNVFDTSLGDILIVRIDDMEFLYIDIGSGVDVGWSAQFRQYNVFPLGFAR